MRGKRSGHASGISYQGNLKQDGDESSSSEMPQSTAAASGSLSSFSTKRAADMFAAYSNVNLDFDFSGGGSSSGIGAGESSPQGDLLSNNHTTTASSLLSATTTNSNGKISSSGSSASGSALLTDIKDGAERLANELDEYLSRGSKKPFIPSKDAPPLSDEAVADLQLATARKLRELLPTNRDLLYTAQERNWIPLLLTWLNLHDRPAVQVEALLALTNIAELCAQQSYYQHSQAQSSAVAAAAQAAAAVVKGSSSSNAGPPAPFYSFGATTSGGPASGTPTPATYPYPSLVAPAPGSVPFPPLSFSQTLSAEAVAAFDASLTSTIQNGSVLDKDKSSKFTLPPAPLFPSATPLPASFQNSALTPPTGGINFTSLAPPPGGAHSAVPNNAFLPPPTPVPGSTGGALASFPQQLSASSQHLLLRHADAIPTLISLLSSPNREVFEQAMWILGSIAVGDSPGTSSSGGSSSASTLDGGREKSVSARDVILAAGVMNQLLRCLESHPTNLSLQRIGSWTLSNLVEGIFQQPSHGKNSNKSSDYSSSDEIEMTTLLPVLRRLLKMTDSEVLSYTCWTLSHLCDGPSSHIAAVVTTKDPKAPKGGLVPRLVDLLLHPSWRVTKPALRTIGNIVCAECSDDNHHGSATTDYTEVILDCEAVPRLKELVTHNNREIQKEACWTLSNIAAGTVDQIQAVIDSGAIPPLVKLVRDKKTDQEVRSEACWVVLNATSCGSDSQIEILVDEGCVSVLGVLLSEASMVMMALEGLERVLQVEETREMLRREQIENGEIEDDEENRTPTLVSAALIEKARESHNNNGVTKRADRIWKQHFVSCALCKKSFSKHRTADATFCEECKCYVCCNCNCKIYHLSYQEELWAATEEKTEQKKSAKKSKNKKKKEKLKQKKAKTPNEAEPVQFANKDVKSRNGPKDAAAEQSRTETVSTTSDVSAEKQNSINKDSRDKEGRSGAAASKLEESKDSPLHSEADDEDAAVEDGPEGAVSSAAEDEKQNQQPAIDFVLYLQQTGSIIALAKLMDALEYGEDYDDFDDAELKLIQQQQMRSRQATST